MFQRRDELLGEQGIALRELRDPVYTPRWEVDFATVLDLLEYLTVRLDRARRVSRRGSRARTTVRRPPKC